MAPKKSTPGQLAVPLLWVGVDDADIHYANQIIVQPGEGTEFFVTFGQVAPPLLTETMTVSLKGAETANHSFVSSTTGSNAAPQQRVDALPFSMRHGTQPDYWTETWRRKEMLADLDILAGNVYDTDDIDDLIRQLDEGIHAAQAD